MNLRHLHMLLGLLLLAPALHSQAPDSLQAFSPYLRVGSSVTYIWNNEVGPADETTLNLNASLVVQPRWSIGVQFLHLWSRSELLGSDQHHLWGGYVQYDLLSERHMRVYPELGLHRGNFCTCGDLDPYRLPGIWYLSMGGGMDIRLIGDLYLELGFYNYHLFTDAPRKYNYTQYVLGLTYVVGRP